MNMAVEARAAGAVAVIVAAGVGSRMRSATPKQYLPLSGGRCVLEAAAAALAAAPPVRRVIVAASPGDERAGELELGAAETWATGGRTRSETVRNTLEKLAGSEPADTLVLVHDAARPLVKPADVEGLVTAAASAGDGVSGAVLAIPVADTVKRVDAGGCLAEDVERRGLVRVATPQAFRLGELLSALREHPDETDESGAIRRAGGRVLAVSCSPENFKITEPGDLAMAGKLAEGRNAPPQLRVGFGYDSHRLAGGRKFILGGVEIPAEKGLDGHSDADALLHAVTDALLGAAKAGNIGILFPPSDMRYRGADSAKLLAAAWELVRAKGWEVVNIDAVVVAERPKLNPHVPAIERRIAEILGIEEDRVSVKPKTNEKMGFEGAGEGVSVRAAALLQRSAQ